MSVSLRRGVALLGLGFLAAGVLATTTLSRESDGSDNPPTLRATQDPVELLAAARAAVDATDRVRLVGSSADATGDYEIDVRALPEKKLCAGTISSEAARMEFVIAGSTAYIRGDRGFWEVSLEAAEEDELDADDMLDFLGERWFQGEMGRRERTLITPLCELDRLLAPSATSTDVELGGTAIFWDRTAQQVRFDYRGETAVLSIDREEPHRPLQLEVVDARSGFVTTKLAFDYDDEVTIVEPDPEDTVTEDGPVVGA